MLASGGVVREKISNQVLCNTFIDDLGATHGTRHNDIRARSVFDPMIASIATCTLALKVISGPPGGGESLKRVVVEADCELILVIFVWIVQYKRRSWVRVDQAALRQ